MLFCRKSLLLCLFLFASSGRALAAGNSDVVVSLGVTQPSLNLTVTDQGSVEKNAEYHEVHYVPRLPLIGLIGFSYKGLGISVSHDLATSSDAYLEYTDYSLGLFYPWIGLSASYTEFLRFRISDSQVFAGELPANEYRRDDLAMRFYSIDAYLFPIRWNFDFGAAFDPSRVKSTGVGLGLIGSANQTAIDTRSGLLPEPWRAAFGPDGAIVGGELTGLGAQLALAASLEFGPLYASALVAGGLGQHTFEYQSIDFSRSGGGNQVLLRTRFDIGLIGKNLFGSFSYNSQAPNYELKFINLTSERSEIGIVTGYKW